MKQSLFRKKDVIELCILYIVCFMLEFMLENIKNIKINIEIVEYFLSGFARYKIPIVLLFSIVVVVYHYQFVFRKKKEIYCRILVGDTLQDIKKRYILENVTILLLNYLLFNVISIYLDIDVFKNSYLFFCFLMYILVSTSGMKNYESI
ncbi:hypothetical protein [Lachnobacterium bovis]|uniref:Uncharacterized protein n=1 Tax=Lachnobacterium bovis DSM 14045 TaxID=1122142 RepID=A0A1H3GDN0_9FIRM|nr:hypothetical protein [Lachnobacterium bovis]SDY01381.1 hypothetical protein SAMN02910414_00539 [Lachnobacterium bovis DSM 14045]